MRLAGGTGTRRRPEGPPRVTCIRDSPHTEGAHLRTALNFCREHAYPRVYLWTVAGLDAARRLYEREGFELADEHRGSQWGTEVLEQKWECPIAETIGA